MHSVITDPARVHPTEIRTLISPSSAVEHNTTSALANYATEAGLNQDQNQVAYGALETLDLITNRSISTMRLLLLIAAFVAVCAAVPISEEVHSDWSLFKTKHSKLYDTEEEENTRFLIFIENRNMIFEHNKKYEEGLVTYKMALNHLADMVQQVSQITMDTNLTFLRVINKLLGIDRN
uniref:Cathepsin propeptide inhibitor domain-containing protein n=1 Tax=Timema genevievae TaxID=629358 RepID=A0A7R9JMF7_TIMGE|nr:unnamed protein product [Timema genevievae]